MASNNARWDPQPPDRGSAGVEARGQPTSHTKTGTMAAEAGVPSDGQGRPIDLLSLMGRAEILSREYQSHTIEKPLASAYRAWNNQHAEGSKYLGTAWKGRSRLFVPKTRSAVRKNLATAAASLFSTQDVVNVEAEHQDDPRYRATAAVMKADLDHRLSQPGKSGIPWYILALGACHDGQLTGVCVSKQFWEYEEVPTGKTKTVMVPTTDEAGQPVMELALDPTTMMPVERPAMVEQEIPEMRVTKDRPWVDLHPIENVGVDPAAPWYSPAQLGRWFYVDYPMGVSDVKAMMASRDKSGQNHWLPVTDEVLLKGRRQEERAGARRVREGGGDRFEEAKAPGELDIVWIRENFLRISGKDYHWWSVGRHAYLSKVRETHEAYPELEGERPYTFGLSQLDPHRVFPMSPVTAWQPLQLELNDITNLRQDTLKRAIAPLALIKKGAQVDVAAVQRRGQPETTIHVNDVEKDIAFVATPGPSGAAYTETSVNNAMFDELAGVFSTSSVQSNRQLNETVGGMRMMSGAANAVSEFDLRMWIETWVEPTLRQLMHLIRRLESDERILMIAGQKARALADHDYMPTLSDFDETDIMLRVNAGIGALDPMQKLAKLKAAMEMLVPMAPAMEAQGIKPNFEALIEEIMGGAGFKDGRRFFEFGEAGEQQPPPELLAALEEFKVEREKMAAQFQEQMLTLRSEEKRNTEDNATLIELEKMRGAREQFKQIVGAVSDHSGAAADREHKTALAREDRTHQSVQAREDREHQTKEAGADRHQKIKEILSGAGEKKPAAKAGAEPAQEAMGEIAKQLQALVMQVGMQQRALQALLERTGAMQ